MVGIASGLAYLGLTKRDMYRCILGLVSRRIAIMGYEQASSFETPSSEFKRFISDSDYRKMTLRIGKQVEPFVLTKDSGYNWKTLIADVLSEHSATLRGIVEETEDDPSFVVTDEVVDSFFGEVLSFILTDDRSVPGEAESTSLATQEPTARYLSSVLHEAIDHFGQDMLFPDISSHLTKTSI